MARNTPKTTVASGFSSFGVNSKVHKEPLGAIHQEGLTKLRSHAGLFVMTDKGPTFCTPADVKAGRVSGFFAAIAGGEVYFNDGSISIGHINTRARDGQASANNPTTWAVGSWLMLNEWQVLGATVYEALWGLVGRRRTITASGYESYSVSPSANSRDLYSLPTSVAQELTSMTWGFSANAKVQVDLDSATVVADEVRTLGSMYAPFGSCRVSMKGVSNGTGEGLTFMSNGSVVKREAPAKKAGSGAVIDEEALNAQLQKLGFGGK